MTHTLAALATSAAAALAAAAPAVAAPLEATTSYGPFAPAAGVTTGADHAAWSVKAGGAWRLVVRDPLGKLTVPPVPPRTIPFDARIGETPDGSVVVGYSRCAREPRPAAGGAVPAWPTARGCSIRLLDATTGRERRLSRTPGATADVLPAVAGGRVTYVSLRAGAATGHVLSRPLAGGRARRVFTGPTRRVRDGGADISQGPAAVAVEPIFGFTALTWTYRVREEGRSTFETRLYSASRRGVVRLAEAGGTTNGACSGYMDLRGLSIDDGDAVAQVVSPVGWELVRADLSQPAAVRARRERAQVAHAAGSADAFLPSVSLGPDRLVLTSPSAVGQIDPPTYRRRSHLVDPYGCA